MRLTRPLARGGKHVEDALQILRGLALVLGRSAAGSPLGKALAATDYKAAEALVPSLRQAGGTDAEAPSTTGPAPAAAAAAASPVAKAAATTAQQAGPATAAAAEAAAAGGRGGDPLPHAAAAAAAGSHRAAQDDGRLHRRTLEPEVHGLQGVTLFDEQQQHQQQGPGTTSGGSRGAAQQSGSMGVAAEAAPAPRKFAPRERAVPSSALARVAGFAGLGASLLVGAARESVSRAWRGGSGGSTPAAGPLLLSEANAERLASALCRMRGAALKLGQMLSIQDEDVLPPQFQAALERVRAGADVMPRRQLDQVLVSELGPEWRSRLAEFDYSPMAAASIGQVHRGALLDGTPVVLKVQYPGVARSIEADVDNMMRLISVANVLPKGLYVENAVRVAKRELALECDYTYEAVAQARMAALVAGEPALAGAFNVPAVVPELSTASVLTAHWVPGAHIDKVAEMAQEVRDAVGTRLLRLTLTELFDWRFMQTDPNWGNFLYDAPTDTLHLVDFGAARDYPASFVADYLAMVAACAERDRDEIIARSTRLGFLTGDESPVMRDAHVEAGQVVGLPFGTPGVYDFGSHGGLTRRVTDLGAVMLKHRLTPPPDDSYSLHRKLSGAFLACIKLRARVPCRELFAEARARHAARGAAEAAAAGEEAAAAAAAV